MKNQNQEQSVRKKSVRIGKKGKPLSFQGASCVVVYEKFSLEFRRGVEAHLKAGCLPLGGPIEYRGKLFQAFIRVDSVKHRWKNPQ
jgi:hypothetical protein